DFNLILQTSVEPGSRVKKGQVIAEFDRLNMTTRLDDYRVSLGEQETSLKTLQTNLDVTKKAHLQSITSAKAALDKAELDLKTIPVQSDLQAEQLKLAAEEARARYKQLLNEVKFKETSQAADLKIARLDYAEAQVEFQRVVANAERMLLRAPIDGVTVMGTTFRGSEFGQIRAGDEVRPGMMVMQVVDPSSMIVNATINQVDVESIRIGMKARVHFDAYPDLNLAARVYSVGAIPKSGGARAAYVKEIPIVLKLDEMDPRVIPDLSVSVDVIVERTQEGVIAPMETVFREAGKDKPFVFVKVASAWERREVELGPASNVAAVIRSGVRPGEVLAAEWPIQEKRK
ncbi:MAG TPA: HlyD family efflux transporter periplasmic adaptor subunit, partial [Bryobacteraceae bacterium]|nr:HlyD family efflux transporter periplasmic adaptor subunit [Bryobacteraceae bacterium]